MRRIPLLLLAATLVVEQIAEVPLPDLSRRGLTPQHPEAEGRPRGPLAERSRYEYGRLVALFETYRQAEPESTPFDKLAQSWLYSLPLSRQRVARAAIRRAHPTACQWDDIAIGRYRRNENRLVASVLTRASRDQLAETLESPRDRALITCLYTLRRAEVAALNWADIDLGPGLAMVRHGKGGKATWTLLTISAQAALARWFTAGQEPPDTTPVFPTKTGGHYTPQSIGDQVRVILARAGLWKPGAGCAHRFRRSFATEYLRANPGDLEGLRRILRHDSIQTTISYVYLQPEDLAPRLARVNL